MNFCGSPVSLSGWYFILSRRYCRRISAVVAPCSITQECMYNNHHDRNAYCKNKGHTWPHSCFDKQAILWYCTVQSHTTEGYMTATKSLSQICDLNPTEPTCGGTSWSGLVWKFFWQGYWLGKISRSPQDQESRSYEPNMWGVRCSYKNEYRVFYLGAPGYRAPVRQQPCLSSLII